MSCYDNRETHEKEKDMWEKWTNDEIYLLTKLYPTISNKSISCYFPNRTYESILWKAKDLGLKKTDEQYRKSRKNNQIYSINENYFNEYSHNMFYVLGFISADGCVTSTNGKNKCVSIHIKKEDKKILEKIKNDMKSNHKIYEYEKSVKLCIVNNQLYNSLQNFGITERKSLTFHFPNIPTEFQSDFIRGYFDGDGTVSKNHYSVKILGTKQFLEMLAEILSKQNIKIHSIYEANPNKQNSSHLTFALLITRKNECEKFAKYIYKNNGIYLERKYDRFYAQTK